MKENVKISVLMFSYYFPPQYSGAALQAISLAKKLRERNIDVAFLTLSYDGLAEVDEVEGFKVYRVKEGEGKFGEFVLWKNIWSFIKKNKIAFDILHSHGGYLRNSFVGPLSKILGKKSLVKISLADNDLYGLGKGKSGLLHRVFLSKVDRYVSISKMISKELRAYGFPDRKICEIPNGVDTERYFPVTPEEKMMLRKQFGLPEKDIMLLYVGVVDERKNVKGLIELWDKFSSVLNGFLAVVGPISRDDKDMRLYNDLKAYGKKMNSRLLFFQYTDRVEDFYKMADVFVLASTNEGMPNAVLEAMSSGLPCVVNKVSGTVDIVDGKNSLLFNVSKPDTFLHGLQKMMDKVTRVKMGRAARDMIVGNFSLDSVAKRYIDIYDDMLHINRLEKIEHSSFFDNT